LAYEGEIKKARKIVSESRTFRELSIEQTIIQHPKDEILVIFWGQDKVMFLRRERVLALNGWWEQAMKDVKLVRTNCR